MDDKPWEPTPTTKQAKHARNSARFVKLCELVDHRELVVDWHSDSRSMIEWLDAELAREGEQHG